MQAGWSTVRMESWVAVLSPLLISCTLYSHLDITMHHAKS